jgi:hypothetical protein
MSQATTFGWDVAFAIRATDVNKAIAKAGSYPKAIALSAKTAGDNWVKADIGRWQIVPGGDTQHILFCLQLENVVFGGRGVDPAGSKIAAIKVHVKFALAFARLSMAAGSHSLKVAPIAHVDPSNPATYPLLCSFDPGDLPAKGLTTLERIALQHGVNQAVIDRLDQFQHVFAELDVSDKVATGDFAWLKPTSVDYAYSCNLNDPDLDNAVLGVMAMTGGRDDGKNAVQISPEVIPVGARAGCMISEDLYLEHGILPRLPILVSGAKVSDFAYIPSKNLIQLQNALPLAPRPSDDGTMSPSSLVKLELQITGDEIRFRSQTRVLVRHDDKVILPGDPHLGRPGKVIPGTKDVCYAHAEQTSFYKLSAGKLVNGKQDIAFVPGPTAGSENQWAEPPDDDPTKPMKMAMMILTISASVLSGFAGAPVIALIYGVITVGSQLYQSLTADGAVLANFQAAPYMDLSAIQKASTFRWSGGKTYELTSVALNNGLQFGGELHF